MSQPMGMTDFFTMEAGDYLERLDVLVSSPTSPEPPDFVRLTRQLKGSAIMAGQDQIASAASGLESLSRAFADGRLTWEEATRQLAIRAVDDLKILVRSVPTWDESHTERAQKIANELERFAGRATVPRRAVTTELDTGTRAFIAREGAAVGSALDRAARTLKATPTNFDSLDSVLRAMQPLRGIASLSDLPPLPDLFEGIERGIQEVRKSGVAHTNTFEVFDAAARAVSTAAREIATEGEANADSDAAQQFAHHLGELLDRDTDVISIETLYHSDDGPHVVQQGGEGQTQLGRVELVSHLEYLRQAADDIERAESDTQRELRAQTLSPTLRILATAAGGPLATASATFAKAARDAINRGVAVQDPTGFASTLREASATLSEAAQANQTQPSNRLTRVIAALTELGTPAEKEQVPVVPEAPISTAVEAAAFAAVAGSDDTQHESTTVVPTDAEEGTDLAAGLIKYLHLIEQVGLEDAHLSELLEGGPDMRGVSAPAPMQTEPDDLAAMMAAATQPPAEPPVIAETPEPETVEVAPPKPASTIDVAAETPTLVMDSSEQTAVPITEFCYSGDAALQRAVSLRSDVRAALESGVVDDTLTDLVEEIFDLVQLGLD